MKRRLLLALALLLAATPAFAREGAVGFKCRFDGEVLRCESFGLSELKRQPEWSLQGTEDGKQIDSARGWLARLRPIRTIRRYLVVLTFFARGDREYTIARTWEAPP